MARIAKPDKAYAFVELYKGTDPIYVVQQERGFFREPLIHKTTDPSSAYSTIAQLVDDGVDMRVDSIPLTLLDYNIDATFMLPQIQRVVERLSLREFEQSYFHSASKSRDLV